MHKAIIFQKSSHSYMVSQAIIEQSKQTLKNDEFSIEDGECQWVRGNLLYL